MTVQILESPASLTTIRFCGVNFTLETLDGDYLIQLYDNVIDHGSDLVERHEALPLHIQAERKEQYRKALAENSQHIVALDKEIERRKTLPPMPPLCPECIQLCLPLDPNELCDGCIEVCNDFESDRANLPDF